MTLAEFEPLADQVLVEPIRELERFEARTASGLYIAQNPQRDKNDFLWLGRVIKCGPGDAVREGSVRPDGSRAAYQAPGGRWPMHVAAGDQVLYERRTWGDVRLDEETYTVLHEEQHIVAVLEA